MKSVIKECLRVFAMIGLLSSVAFSVAAMGQDNGLSYDYVELRFVSVDLDGSDGDGLEVGGQFKFNDEVFVMAGYDDWEFDFGGDLSILAVGAGLILPQDQFDLIARFSLLNVSSDSINDDNGYQFGFGARSMIKPQLEAFGSVEYRDFIDDTDTFVSFGVDYFFDPELSAGVMLDIMGDVDVISFGGRYHF